MTAQPVEWHAKLHAESDCTLISSSRCRCPSVWLKRCRCSCLASCVESNGLRCISSLAAAAPAATAVACEPCAACTSRTSCQGPSLRIRSSKPRSRAPWQRLRCPLSSFDCYIVDIAVQVLDAPNRANASLRITVGDGRGLSCKAPQVRHGLGTLKSKFVSTNASLPAPVGVIQSVCGLKGPESKDNPTKAASWAWVLQEHGATQTSSKAALEHAHKRRQLQFQRRFGCQLLLP